MIRFSSSLPGEPEWLNKTVATLSVGPVEAQLIGDFVGRRFATFTNDASVPDNVLPLRRAEIALQRLHPDGSAGP